MNWFLEPIHGMQHQGKDLVEAVLVQTRGPVMIPPCWHCAWGCNPVCALCHPQTWWEIVYQLDMWQLSLQLERPCLFISFCSHQHIRWRYQYHTQFAVIQSTPPHHSLCISQFKKTRQGWSSQVVHTSQWGTKEARRPVHVHRANNCVVRVGRRGSERHVLVIFRGSPSQEWT